MAPFLLPNMPFASQAQQRFAFGTHQPWAKRWARATDFANLPKRVRVKLRQARQKDVSAAAPAAGYAHGPGGLASAPGLGGKRQKAAASSAGMAMRISGPISMPSTSDSRSGVFGETAYQIPSQSFQTRSRNDSPRRSQKAETPDRHDGPSATIVSSRPQHGQSSAIDSIGPIDSSNPQYSTREKTWSAAARAAALEARRRNAKRRAASGGTASSSSSSAGRLARSGRASGSGRSGRAGRSPIETSIDKLQRAAERQAARADNRAATLRKLNIAPDGQQALEALRGGQQPDPAALARGGFVDAGLVEQARDGSYRLTASGRAALSAADAGDLGRAGDTISAARDRATAREQRRQAAADRKRAAEAKRQAAAQRRAELAKRRTASGGRASTSDQPAAETGPEADSGDAQQVLVDRLRGLLEQARARQARATEQAAKRGRGRSWARVIMPKRVRRKAHMMSRDEEKAMFANLAKSGKLRRKKPGTAAASGQKEEPKKEAPKGLHQAISEAEDKIRAQRHETAHVFSPNGESLFSNDGGKDYVDFSDAAIANIKGRNATLTHNHPGGWDYPKNDPRHAGNSFSLEDARMAVAADLAEIRAVTPTRTYSLRRPPSGWDGSKLERAYADVNRETRRTFTDRIQHGQMTIAEAEAQHTHTVWQQVAAAIGAGYSYEGT